MKVDTEKAKEKPSPKKGKADTVWGFSDKVRKKDLDRLDKSEDKNAEMDYNAWKEQYLGKDGEEEEKIPNYVSDDESLHFSSAEEETKKAGAQKSGGIFSRLTNSIRNYTGNKVLTDEDLEPIMRDFSKGLMEKNVAHEIAIALTESVKRSLINQKTESFTSVKRTVQNALTEAIKKILTPKKFVSLSLNPVQAHRHSQRSP